MASPLPSLVQYEPAAQPGSKEHKKQSKKGQLPPVDKGLLQPDDILHRILPPRKWTQEGTQLEQQVSVQPATRLDVINLQECLDQQLQQRQARETGICPVREELYAQCFDEIVRQITINGPERGLLLLRVRDEMRMTVAAYQTLYESAVAFGMRKALQTEQGKPEMVESLQALESEKAALERRVAEYKMKCEAIETRENERRDAEERSQADELAYLKKYYEQLKVQVDSYMNNTKKPGGQ